MLPALDIVVNTHVRHGTVFTLSWMLQAGLWSVLSLVGTVYMVSWTYFLVKKTLELGALRLGNPDVIGIAAD